MKVEHQNLSRVDTWRLSEALTEGAIFSEQSTKLFLQGCLVLLLSLFLLLLCSSIASKYK